LFSQTKSARLPELREVERLVEGADVRRAVAEERDRDARLVAQLEREPAPTIAADRRRSTAFAPRFPRSTSYRCIEPP
jgi:hypothetical protein